MLTSAISFSVSSQKAYGFFGPQPRRRATPTILKEQRWQRLKTSVISAGTTDTPVSTVWLKMQSVTTVERDISNAFADHFQEMCNLRYDISALNHSRHIHFGLPFWCTNKCHREYYSFEGSDRCGKITKLYRGICCAASQGYKILQRHIHGFCESY